jgi:hypothetical protein
MCIKAMLALVHSFLVTQEGIYIGHTYSPIRHPMGEVAGGGDEPHQEGNGD